MPSNVSTEEADERALDLCDLPMMLRKPICLTRDDYYGLCRIRYKDIPISWWVKLLRFWNGYVRARGNGAEQRDWQTKADYVLEAKMPSWSEKRKLENMDNRQSGSLLMDLCIHDIDWLYWLLHKYEQLL